VSSDLLLTINAGSSSLKFATFRLGDLTCDLRGQLSGIGQGAAKFSGVDWPTGNLKLANHRDAVALLIARLDVGAVGHRVVHGGTRFTAPVRIDAATTQALRDLIPLAPLHQPHNVAAIEAVASARPDVPQVACFDTGFPRRPCPKPRRASRCRSHTGRKESGVMDSMGSPMKPSCIGSAPTSRSG
jgi:acetate kinase